jgi:uncharacterized repeat protein (TIGR04052 family)
MDALEIKKSIKLILKNSLSALSLVTMCGFCFAEESTNIDYFELIISPQINSKQFTCGHNYKLSTHESIEITPTDWRMFVSQIAFIRANGERRPVALNQDGVWQKGDTVLLDFENGQGPCRNGNVALNYAIRGTVPDDQYVGIEMQIAVPFQLNHSDPTIADAPLSTTAMFWNWQGGYKFLRFDATLSKHNSATNANTRSAMSFHLGSTGCASASKTTAPATACRNPNTVEIVLEGKDPRSTPIGIDIAEVFKGVDFSKHFDTSPLTCMSFPGNADCSVMMKNIGLPYGQEKNAAKSTQLFFWK